MIFSCAVLLLNPLDAQIPVRNSEYLTLHNHVLDFSKLEIYEIWHLLLWAWHVGPVSTLEDRALDVLSHPNHLVMDDPSITNQLLFWRSLGDHQPCHAHMVQLYVGPLVPCLSRLVSGDSHFSEQWLCFFNPLRVDRVDDEGRTTLNISWGWSKRPSSWECGMPLFPSQDFSWFYDIKPVFNTAKIIMAIMAMDNSQHNLHGSVEIGDPQHNPLSLDWLKGSFTRNPKKIHGETQGFRLRFSLQSSEQIEVTIFFDAQREFREQLYLSWSFATTAVWVTEVMLEAQPCDGGVFNGFSRFGQEKWWNLRTTNFQGYFWICTMAVNGF